MATPPPPPNVPIRPRQCQTRGAAPASAHSFRSTSGHTICPVTAMRHYLAVREASSPSAVVFVDGYLRPITTRALTRTLKKAGQFIGLDPRRLSSHCLRISGASHGAEIGLSELQLAQAGRWSSLTAMRRYVRRPVSLLQVTPSAHPH